MNDVMTNTTAAELIARLNRLDADPKNTNYTGGNTSAKGTETDPVTGEPAELLWVKGSGGGLVTLTEHGLAVLRLDRLRALVNVCPGLNRENEMVAAFDYTPHGKGVRMSRESRTTVMAYSRFKSLALPIVVVAALLPPVS